jgi:hypothetical protein
VSPSSAKDLATCALAAQKFSQQKIMLKNRMASLIRGRTEPASSEIDDKLLFDEYKLLQDKIDRIGAYKFQIKGLTITLVGLWLKVVSDIIKDH